MGSQLDRAVALVANGLLESVPGRTRYTAAYQLTDEGREASKQYT